MPKMAEGLCAGCGEEKLLKARGYCRACYQQWKRTGSVVRERQPRGQCTVEGCDKQAHGKGLCDMHARRLRVSGTLDDPRADNANLRSNHALYSQWQGYTRAGAYPIVDAWKNDFFAFLDGVGDRPTPAHRLYRLDKKQPMGPGNFEWREKITTRHGGETTSEYNNRYRRERKAKLGTALWDSELRAKYGIGTREWVQMRADQNGCCAVCGSTEVALSVKGDIRAMSVDHDHRTDAVREMTCLACNTLLGAAADDVRILHAAIGYLIKHKAEPGETRFVPFDNRLPAA